MAAKSGRTRHPGRASAKRPDAKHAGGRPSAFRDSHCEQARKLCLLGFTDAALADFFGVSTVTLWKWKHSHPEFVNALNAGKAVADCEVASKLYERALGCSHKAVKIFNTESGTVEHEYTEHHPPDTTAAIFWLKNRDPGRWRDKQLLEHTGKDGAPIRIEDMAALSDAELMAIAGRKA